MKRFILDFLFVVMLVMIGNSLTSYESLDNQINDYEYQIDNNYPTTNNKATIFVIKSGETIENVIGISVEIISSIFKAILE